MTTNTNTLINTFNIISKMSAAYPCLYHKIISLTLLHECKAFYISTQNLLTTKQMILTVLYPLV